MRVPRIYCEVGVGMYLTFYKLREFPFAITCDEKYFYESAVHAEALANMMYTIQQRKGMAMVTVRQPTPNRVPSMLPRKVLPAPISPVTSTMPLRC